MILLPMLSGSESECLKFSTDTALLPSMITLNSPFPLVPNHRVSFRADMA